MIVKRSMKKSSLRIMNTATQIICPYCGRSVEGSEEHVIPHKLGGALKSYKICYERCNNIYRQETRLMSMGTKSFSDYGIA